MSINLLRALQDFGQSIWLDDLHRGLLRGRTGRLARLIDNDGISGATSNAGILRRAIAQDPSYTVDIRRLHADGAAPGEIYEQLILRDVRDAAELLRRADRRSGGHDGFVSVQIPPMLAMDCAGTLAEARRLWHALDRPNAMIEVPATHAGLQAVRRLISEGINTNVTFICGLTRYRKALDAFTGGLEDRKAAGGRIDHIASVASLLVTRIDTAVDRRLAAVHDSDRPTHAGQLLGRAGIAAARLAYQGLKKFMASPRWRALAAAGARPQRLLWADTETRNPACGEFKYIDELIGRDTITTMSATCLDAYRRRGRPAPRLEKDLYEAALLSSDLLSIGIDLEQICPQLQAEEIARSSDSFQSVLSDISTRWTDDPPRDLMHPPMGVGPCEVGIGQ